MKIYNFALILLIICVLFSYFSIPSLYELIDKVYFSDSNGRVIYPTYDIYGNISNSSLNNKITPYFFLKIIDGINLFTFFVSPIIFIVCFYIWIYTLIKKNNVKSIKLNFLQFLIYIILVFLYVKTPFYN